MNNKIVHYGLVLLLFCAIAGGVLAFVNGFTEPVIAQAEFEKSVEAYEGIYGDLATDFEPMDEEITLKLQEQIPEIDDIFIAKNGEEVIGYGINFKANGYGGEMINAVGLLNDKTMAGFKNISHAETPGIGAQITEAFYEDSFVGTSFEGGSVVGSPSGQGENEIMLISGATISTSGVLNALNNVLANYDAIAAQ
ncbi:MAG: FMN-binding protein [Tissierellia bacterium]|nr:FMN-binding protein [Tissierellia bacterium]